MAPTDKTTTHKIAAKGATLHATSTGSGPPLLFIHALGLDHTVWQGVIRHFPDHCVITYDLRGHGASDAPTGPYAMGQLVADAEAVCVHFALKEACVIGHSVGGMIAQGLAVKRLDLVRALGLVATAAKFGQPGPWRERASTARTRGMAALAPDILTRWTPLGPHDAPLDAQLRATPPEGYASTCEAIAGTDFYTPTSGLRLSTLGLCGTLDAATPPDLVRETTDLIPGSTFHLIRGAGHMAPLTHPDMVADLIAVFLKGVGHV
ncbi:alpha/beta fold hydrolase [Pseudooctadecabacter jejudonensis]|uniref:3-oxoadipate enol-lactonase 2 n=1 Tax=Pseudooctadecabacter jejudonensis TaxID=1391910 RepID=A0A1Y5SQB0_9RHOB|nr:alpha/beta fold hydrolase [Pseudooctadecabacter jejudonensis]SLN45305.1 3-oxoadipate enol-lactonase 2 [Pseudooctadecabacter jejudonensis]